MCTTSTDAGTTLQAFRTAAATTTTIPCIVTAPVPFADIPAELLMAPPPLRPTLRNIGRLLALVGKATGSTAHIPRHQGSRHAAILPPLRERRVGRHRPEAFPINGTLHRASHSPSDRHLRAQPPLVLAEDHQHLVNPDPDPDPEPLDREALLQPLHKMQGRPPPKRRRTNQSQKRTVAENSEPFPTSDWRGPIAARPLERHAPDG